MSAYVVCRLRRRVQDTAKVNRRHLPFHHPILSPARRFCRLSQRTGRSLLACELPLLSLRDYLLQTPAADLCCRVCSTVRLVYASYGLPSRRSRDHQKDFGPATLPACCSAAREHLRAGELLHRRVTHTGAPRSLCARPGPVSGHVLILGPQCLASAHTPASQFGSDAVFRSCADPGTLPVDHLASGERVPTKILYYVDSNAAVYTLVGTHQATLTVIACGHGMGCSVRRGTSGRKAVRFG